VTFTTFEIDDDVVHVETSGCFEPNLTTKVMATCARAALTRAGSEPLSVVEIGCGSGVISKYLLQKGVLGKAKFLGLSDISPEAVQMAEKNIRELQRAESDLAIKFAIGSGLEPWKDRRVDFIVNDVSAISDAVAHMSDWFAEAPNNAGIDGIDNTVEILNQFAANRNFTGEMLIPVLSLSNVPRLLREITERGLLYEKMESRLWPLPSDMASTFGEELDRLSKSGYIQIQNKFGKLIVETTCFKIIKN
jgi:SAM-dependent methyltransferase